MKTMLVIALLVVAFAVLPTAEAHHLSPCDPEYPCNPVPCSLKCWMEHVKLCATRLDCF